MVFTISSTSPFGLLHMVDFFLIIWGEPISNWYPELWESLMLGRQQRNSVNHFCIIEINGQSRGDT